MDNDEERDDDLEQAPELENDVEQVEEVADETPLVEEQEEEIDWQERALKAEKVIEERKRKEKEAKKVNPPQTPQPQPPTANPIGDMDAVLARLENRGVMEHEDQQYVLRFAKAEGISPVEALQDEVVKDKLAFLKKQREQKSAAQTPGNRTGVSNSKSVDYYISKGIIPTDPDMADKVQTEIARRARAGA